MGSGSGKLLNLKLKVWRQKSAKDQGRFVELDANKVSEDASFLEMLDQVNEQLVMKGEEPIVFDHDCREGICGSCGFMINGQAHGPMKNTTVCQLHMRNFKDGETLVLEPWRASAFPIVKDLMTNRSALDRIIAAGGYVSVDTGNAQDANNIPIPKPDADAAFESATCIGCGACVASCKNASAMLFTWLCCNKAKSSAMSELWIWLRKWMLKVSETARQRARARLHVQKASHFQTSL